MPDRRKLIADAAITVIDQYGARGLTHRRVDATAGLPTGTTSYHAPTRKELLGLVVGAIANDPDLKPSEMEQFRRPATIDEAVSLLVDGIERSTRAGPALRARSAILPELAQWPELSDRISDASRIAQDRYQKAAEILQGIGVSPAEQEARELTALCEALLLYRVTRQNPIDLAAVLKAYLVGLGGGWRDAAPSAAR